MAVRVNAIMQEEELWLADMTIRFGVYSKAHYPVRLVDVPRAPVNMSREDQTKLLSAFIMHDVIRHMKKGSLPPKGVQISGEHVWDFEPDAPVENSTIKI